MVFCKFRRKKKKEKKVNEFLQQPRSRELIRSAVAANLVSPRAAAAQMTSARSREPRWNRFFFHHCCCLFVSPRVTQFYLGGGGLKVGDVLGKWGWMWILHRGRNTKVCRFLNAKISWRHDGFIWKTLKSSVQPWQEAFSSFSSPVTWRLKVQLCC